MEEVVAAAEAKGAEDVVNAHGAQAEAAAGKGSPRPHEKAEHQKRMKMREPIGRSGSCARPHGAKAASTAKRCRKIKRALGGGCASLAFAAIAQ